MTSASLSPAASGDAPAGTLDLEGAPDGGLTTVTLTLSGSPAFGAALRERWGV